MNRKFLIYFFLITVFSSMRTVYSQVLDFSSPATACLTENIQLVNSSVGITGNLIWDFCEGELLEPVEATIKNRINSIDQAAGIVTVQNETGFFTFVLDRGTNSLHLLSFGSSLGNTPVSNQVVLPASVSLLSPQGLKVIRVNNLWYGFIVSTGNSKVYRLDFGAQVTNKPTATELNFSGTLSTPIEIELAQEGTDYQVMVVNFSGNNLIAANLGNTISNQPQSFNVIALPGASSPYGFSLKKFSDGIWRGIVGSFSNGNFHTVTFDNGLTQMPSVANITSLLPPVSNPVKLALETWGQESVLHIINASGDLKKIRFVRGAFLNSVQSTDDLGNYGASLTYSLAYDNGSWRGLTFSNSTRDLSVLFFKSPCAGVNANYFQGETPPSIQFSESGVKDVSLISQSSGFIERKTKSISVTSTVAPSIDFTSEGICTTGSVFFASSSNQSISTYHWNFGDSGIATSQNTSHQYISAGVYDITLNAVGVNNCNNQITKEIKIYTQPVTAFQLPSGLICTNNQFTFTNNTPDNFDGNLVYEWLVNNETVSVSRDLQHAFTNTGDQEIKLKTSIPGCFSEQTQTLINVQGGPVVDFLSAGKCETESISFTNNSTGLILGYQWNFGDGELSTALNPTHTYATHGNYTVSLSANGANGCVSTLSKQVNVYSVPDTDFTLELPPFSCSGSLSQFNDATPGLPDSNIQTWNWQFGDANTGTSSIKNATYTYMNAGNYDVTLTTTTNNGCVNSITKPIVIYPSPVADFSFAPACINQGTKFTDSSSGEIKGWFWAVQSSTYSVKDPTHIFRTAGSQNVLLSVTGTNNCIGQKEKLVNIPLQADVNFIANNVCADALSVFQDTSAEGSDPTSSVVWDFGDFTSAAGQSVTHTYQEPGYYTVRMLSTRMSGCTYSAIKNIFVNDPPHAAFEVLLDAGPAPFGVDFVNTSVGATWYQWNFNDANDTGSSEYSPSFVFTTLGDYQVELIAFNNAGCSDSYTHTISVVIPRVNAFLTELNAKPVSANGWSPEVTIKNNGNVALINPEVFLDVSGSQLVSERVNQLIKPGEVYTHLFSTIVPYSNVNYACADLRISADEEPFDNKQCISFTQETVGVTPYPNPANDEILIEFIKGETDQVQVSIINSSGQVVSNKLYETLLSGLNQVKVNVSSLTEGIYFVVIKSGNNSQNFRFSIMR